MSSRSKMTVVALVGAMCCAVYPAVIMPLMAPKASQAFPRPQQIAVQGSDAAAGFQRKGMWGSVDGRLKDK